MPFHLTVYPCRQRLLVGTHTGEVKVFDTSSTALLDSYQCHDSAIYSIRPAKGVVFGTKFLVRGFCLSRHLFSWSAIWSIPKVSYLS